MSLRVLIFLAINLTLGAALAIAGEKPQPKYPPRIALANPIVGAEQYLLSTAIEGGSGVLSRGLSTILPPIYKADIAYVGDHKFITRHFDYELKEDVRFLRDDRNKPLLKLPDWVATDRTYHNGVLNLSIWGHVLYVGERGKIILNDKKYYHAADFDHGLASVYYKDRGFEWAAVIGPSGKIKYGPFRNGEIRPFINNAAIVIAAKDQNDGKQCAFLLSSHGQRIIPPIYDSLQTSDGITFFARKDGKSCLMTKSQKVLAHFPDNCVEVKLPERIDTNSLIPARFEDFNPIPKLKEPTSSSRPEDTSWGYCSAKGSVVVPPQFFACDNFNGEQAQVYFKEKNSTDVKSVRIHRPGY